MKKLLYIILFCANIGLLSFSDSCVDFLYLKNNKKKALVYTQKFEKQISILHQRIKKYDNDLRYWRKELYNSRNKDYGLNIDKLEQLIKDECTLLGVVLEHFDYFKQGDLECDDSSLKNIEQLFQKHYNSLDLCYQICKSPHHLKKHWKAYITGGTTLTALIAACIYNKESLCRLYATAKGKWDDRLFMKFGVDGSTPIPQPTSQENPVANGVENSSWFWVGRNILGPIRRKAEAIKAAISEKTEKFKKDIYEQTVGVVVNMIDWVPGEIDEFQKKVFRPIVLTVAGVGLGSPTFVASGITYFAVKGQKLDDLRHCDKELWSAFELGDNSNELRNRGFIHFYTEEIKQLLSWLPKNVAQELYNDCEKINRTFFSLEQKQKITNRWKHCFSFLKK